MKPSSELGQFATNGDSAKRNDGRLPYMPGIDGLRALAVLAVIVYHSEFENFTGGFLGVEIFFVISGYLITALLLNEYSTNSTVNLRRFWTRRARRLLPALLIYIAGSVALAYALADDVVPTKGEILSTLGYVYNWFGIFQEISYTEVFERKNFFHHLWSLAIEEQFYLVWPLILLAFQKYLNKRLTILLISLGIATSSFLMWVLYEPFKDPLRIYYGTDTRASGLLMGALLAYLWRPWSTEKSKLFSWKGERIFLLAGFGAIGLLLWSTMNYTLLMPDAEQLFRGGFLFTSVITAIVIGCTVTPNSYLSSCLGIAPLVWIGKRSYGLYLWHWPVFQLTRERVDVDINGWELFGVRMFITLVLVEISYQCFERPIREQTFLTGLRNVKTSNGFKSILLKAGFPVLGIIASLMVLQGVQVDRNTQQYEVSSTIQSQAESNEDEENATEEVIPSSPKLLTEPESNPTPLEIAVQETLNADETEDTENQNLNSEISENQVFSIVDFREEIIDNPSRWQDLKNIVTYTIPIYFHRITFIGDSVMLGALTNIGNEGVEEAFREDIATISNQVTVSAAKNRQWYELRGIIRELDAKDELGEIVVIHLGNNGVIDERIITESLELLTEVRKVLLVNVRVPRRWEDKVNNLLDDAAETFENAKVVDWYSISNENPQFFTRDGVHTVPSGAKHYVNAIIESLGGESVVEKMSND